MVLGAALGSVVSLAVASRWRMLPAAWLWRAFAVAAAARLLLLFLPPLMSEDLWRYLWDGALQHLGHGPYDHAPASPLLDAAVARLPGLGDVRDQIGHPQIPTIYPPAAQAAFWLATLVGPHALIWRAIALAAELGGAAALCVWLRRTERDPRAVLLWLFCPLPALEAAVGGHVDAVGVLGLTSAGAMLAGLSGVMSPRARHRDAFLGGVMFSLAVGTKLFPLVALPRLGRAAIAGCLFASAVFALPYLGGTPQEALTTYSHRWRGNDGLFALIVYAFEQVWPAGGPPVELGALWTSIGRHLVGPPGPGLGAAGLLAPLWPDELAFASAKLVAGALLGLVTMERLWRGRSLEAVLGPITATLLLVAPVVHPWYLLWWLPFGVLAAAGSPASMAGSGVAPTQPATSLSWPFFVWTLTIWLAYLPRIARLDGGRGEFPNDFAALEYVPVWIALVSAAWGKVKTRPRSA